MLFNAHILGLRPNQKAIIESWRISAFRQAIMLLTITSTGTPATDLGYLLHKNPGSAQSFDLSFGRAHVFYPEANDARCTVALLLEVDPIGMVRADKGAAWGGFALGQYVNDRPYVASSFISVAIAKVLHSALTGKSKERPALVDTALPLQARISVLPCEGGADLIRRLFEPLGYAVTVQGHQLDAKFPDWGASDYFTVELSAKVPLKTLVTHLYVLIPVLDGEKHYWVGDDEIEKLLHHGEGWLTSHPERELVTKRYLKNQHSLTEEALSRLLADEAPSVDGKEEKHLLREDALEARISLNEHRMNAVVTQLRALDAKRVLDLGCGEGRLLRKLLEDRAFTEIVGMDVSHRSLEKAAKRLRLDQMAPMQRERLKHFVGSLVYRDKRLKGYDAACLVEVIEHLDPPRIASLERVVFEFAKPRSVLVTTPNSEYNVKFDSLPAGTFRHLDHRFEWTRAQFKEWADSICRRYACSVKFLPVGQDDPTVGAPTQMAVFTL